jgi:hypothetical protein
MGTDLAFPRLHGPTNRALERVTACESKPTSASGRQRSGGCFPASCAPSSSRYQAHLGPNTERTGHREKAVLREQGTRGAAEPRDDVLAVELAISRDDAYVARRPVRVHRLLLRVNDPHGADAGLERLAYLGEDLVGPVVGREGHLHELLVGDASRYRHRSPAVVVSGGPVTALSI